jgi:hypothetical protein
VREHVDHPREVPRLALGAHRGRDVVALDENALDRASLIAQRFPDEVEVELLRGLVAHGIEAHRHRAGLEALAGRAMR